MIEPEMAFFELEDNILTWPKILSSLSSITPLKTAVKIWHSCKNVWKKKKNQNLKMSGRFHYWEKLRFVIDNAFERITYTEAIDILLKSKPHKEKKFQYEVAWAQIYSRNTSVF